MQKLWRACLAVATQRSLTSLELRRGEGGYRIMVIPELSKLQLGVRFPIPAQYSKRKRARCDEPSSGLSQRALALAAYFFLYLLAHSSNQEPGHAVPFGSSFTSLCDLISMVGTSFR
jgi:hypothetical protein